MAGDVALFVRRQGFWWCLVHSGDIERSIIAVKTAIDDAFTGFNVGLSLRPLYCTSASTDFYYQ